MRHVTLVSCMLVIAIAVAGVRYRVPYIRWCTIERRAVQAKTEERP